MKSLDGVRFDKQIIVIMLGMPGAGKSYFAWQLADRLDWRRLNRVAVRKELFGDQAVLKLPEHETVLGKVLQARLKDIMQSRQSVICDYQHNLKSKRDRMRQLAEEFGATLIAIWIQTPIELAVQRGMSREDSWDSVRASHQHIREIISNNLEQLETPSEDEPVLRLGGLLDFEEQFGVFLDFCQQHALMP